MATPFYGTISLRKGDGTLQVDRFDSTDVTLAYVTFKSNGGLTYLTAQDDCVISDIVLNIAAAGTTKDFKLFLNGRDSNIRWVQSANFPALSTHFPNLNPIPIARGTMIQIQAIT